jgi:hypothetical protein
MVDPFENLSDEQLLAMIREASREPGTAKETPKPEKASVRLADGSVIEAETAEELNRLLAARLEGTRPAPAREEPKTPPNAGAPAPVKWDLNTFTQKFVQDPDEGLEYLEIAKYGMPVRKAVPQMLAITAALAAKVQELETASFAPKVDAERQAVEQIMRERNWAPSRQSFQDALDIAKARGMVRTEEKSQERREEPRPQTFIPPRTPRASSEEQPANEEELLRAANDMPLDQLEELLMRAGHLKARRT